MSKAYAQEFGVPTWVTDSYRNYDEQVAVAAAKPDLAARPGSSNHGWGVATDLCDGIQAFGTPTHAWMVDNSMLYGWFLPSWAQQNGSSPEAWHWEFAG
jgi:LAS superfamily LD-carboxypeptidase LdcB